MQSFASYGGARRGTPVSSFIRVDDRPIRVRCDIEQADAILCFDASLLEGRAARHRPPRHADRRQFVADAASNSPSSCRATG